MGTPYDLITNDTLFREMVRENGKEFESKMVKASRDKDANIFSMFSNRDI